MIFNNVFRMFLKLTIRLFATFILPEMSKVMLNNTGVGSLSLLQGIFPTQELNQGLLHCRWILYQLSYQESPLNNTLDCKTMLVKATKQQNYTRAGKKLELPMRLSG